MWVIAQSLPNAGSSYQSGFGGYATIRLARE
jgi:hypothetical protein